VAEGDEGVRCLRGTYAWEEVKMVRGGVVEFVMEFCPKVVAAVGFYAGSRAFFRDGSEEMCDAIMCWC
jgi:hypothetical protein